MATKNQFAAVLASIKNAPNSIGVEMIATRSGLSQVVVRTIVSALCETRHIKENGEREGTFFTRTPMREEIAAFLEAQNATLTGITFDEPGRSVEAAFGTTSAQALLGRIFENPASHEVTASNMMVHVQTLLDLGLIRKHRDYSDRYFTVSGKRADIRRFLDGVISWAELIGENTDHNPGPVAPVIPATPREGVWVRFPFLENPSNPLKEYRADVMANQSTNNDGPYFYGNYEESYRSILNRIATALHAIDSVRDVNATLRLVNLGFLRVHRDDNSKLFTAPNKRNDIKRYLQGELSIRQLFGIDPMPVPTETTPASLLRAIRNAPESVAVPECEARNTLVNDNMIREHRDKPGFYFTVPENRDLIDEYLAGEITLDEMLEFASGYYPCCVEDPCNEMPTTGNPDVLALAQAVRNLADVVIRANS